MDSNQLMAMLQSQLAERQKATQAATAPKRKKRGGLAGIWDRNKHIIKPVASGVAGAFGGPAAAALVGGAMGGLDRKGKGGIGFDVGQGVRGAVSGAAAGAAGAGLRGMFAGAGGLAGAKAGLQGYGSQMGLGKAGRMVAVNPTTGLPIQTPNAGALRTALGSARSMASPVINWIGKNPDAAGLAMQGAGQMMAANQMAGLQRENMQFERDLFNQRERDRVLMAQQLLPLFASLQNRLQGAY